MKNRRFVTIFPLMMLIVLFGFGCNSVQQSNSEKPKTPVETKTKITKDNLKTRLSGKKVTFLEKSAEQVDISVPMLPKLKIVNNETPPKVELNGEILEFSQLLNKLDYIFKGKMDKRVILAASESDIAFYNKEGISVENLDLLIGNLDDVDEFIVDFGEIEFPNVTSPQPKTTGFPSSKTELPKDDEPPLRKSTPK